MVHFPIQWCWLEDNDAVIHVHYLFSTTVARWQPLKQCIVVDIMSSSTSSSSRSSYCKYFSPSLVCDRAETYSFSNHCLATPCHSHPYPSIPHVTSNHRHYFHRPRNPSILLWLGNIPPLVDESVLYLPNSRQSCTCWVCTWTIHRRCKRRPRQCREQCRLERRWWQLNRGRCVVLICHNIFEGMIGWRWIEKDDDENWGIDI